MAEPHTEYIRLLRDAHESSHAIAEFVLHDDDPESVAAKEELLRSERTCNLALIRHVRDNLTALDAYFMLPGPRFASS